MIIVKKEVLTESYLPEVLMHREAEIIEVASFLKEKPPTTLLVYGPYGVGKTSTVRYVMKRYKEELDVPVFYINSGISYGKNQFFNNLFQQAGLLINMGRKSIEEGLKALINSGPFSLVVDEANILLAKNRSLLYALVRRFQTVGENFPLILISPTITPFIKSDSISMSSFKMLEFKPYTFKEMKDILLHRAKLALYPDSYTEEAIGVIAAHCYKKRPYVRLGINLLYQSAIEAEKRGTQLTEHIAKGVIEKYKSQPGFEMKESVKKDILDILQEGPRTSKEISKILNIPGRTVREHLKELKAMGLVISVKQGRREIYEIS